MSTNGTNSAPLLVELFTEELPPKALQKLATAFAQDIFLQLVKLDFVPSSPGGYETYATPRRIGLSISNVRDTCPDVWVTKKIMPVANSLSPDGSINASLQKRLNSLEISFDQLSREFENGKEFFVYRSLAAGVPLSHILGAVVEAAIENLPIPKVMSYQLPESTESVKFVRPAHGLVVLHGNEVVTNVRVLGLTAGRIAHGHRFLGAADIELRHANEYETRLKDEGKVIVSFDSRRAEIEHQLRGHAMKLGCELGDYATLLDEVTALVEWPVVYVAGFEKEFLSVPQECLILTMRTNQKYFPLFDKSGKLTEKFLVVSNMQVADPKNIIEGNQRVVRPRLADARFFYNQDRKKKLSERVDDLKKVVYHNKLGSQFDRVHCIERLSGQIAKLLTGEGLRLASEENAKRAACLAKADLLTSMVGEFPELQGIMGRYYARHDGEDDEVASAIEEHYHPRFAGDSLPETMTGTIVALADKLYTLMAMFGIGALPSGDKDPFALRRAALGVLRILIEKQLPLSNQNLMAETADVLYGKIASNTQQLVKEFLSERLRGYLRDQGYEFHEIEAVLSIAPSHFNHEIIEKISAVRTFLTLPEAESLATANKRISNILKKADLDRPLDNTLLSETAEKALADAIRDIAPEVTNKFSKHDYTGMLKSLGSLKTPVDNFFNDVMVVVEDDRIRANRFALLRELHGLMNRVADISKLAA